MAVQPLYVSRLTMKNNEIWDLKDIVKLCGLEWLYSNQKLFYNVQNIWDNVKSFLVNTFELKKDLKERRPERMSACVGRLLRADSIILSWFFGYFFIKKKVTRNKMSLTNWITNKNEIRHFFLHHFKDSNMDWQNNDFSLTRFLFLPY